MDSKDIRDLLKKKFDEGIEEVVEGNPGDGWIKVGAGHLVAIATYLKEDPGLQFDLLHCITGLDLGDGTLESIYNFTSTTKLHWLTVKVGVPIDNPKIPTVSHLWRTADWHERESFDLLGILYQDHPNLVRILCDKDWVGHPLRRDYEFPKEFQGVPCDVVQEEEDDIPLPRTIGVDGIVRKGK